MVKSGDLRRAEIRLSQGLMVFVHAARKRPKVRIWADSDGAYMACIRVGFKAFLGWIDVGYM